MFSHVFDFNPNEVPTHDGTFRIQDSSEEFWDEILASYKDGDNTILVAEGECYRRRTSRHEIEGFGGTVFRFKMNTGRQISSKITHIGSVPLGYRNKITNNCVFI